jgi:serine/threonine protein kinase
MWEKYEKIRKIGEGGMAEVWLVQHKTDRTLFAAKYLSHSLIRDKDRERFIREATILKNLNHENIIKIIDLPTTSEELGYVMEYCPDGNITKYSGSTNKEMIFKILKELALAVAYLHSKDFIHRDIKPENILISPNEMMRLSDFGLAVSSKVDREVITTSNWFSPGFAAPEQQRDMKSVNYKADIFSIGAVYYYLLTNKTINVFDPLEKQIEQFEGFDKIVLEKTLTKDLEKRFDNAIEIHVAVFDFIGNSDSKEPRMLQEYFLKMPSEIHRSLYLQKIYNDYLPKYKENNLGAIDVLLKKYDDEDIVSTLWDEAYQFPDHLSDRFKKIAEYENDSNKKKALNLAKIFEEIWGLLEIQDRY